MRQKFAFAPLFGESGESTLAQPTAVTLHGILRQ
jgi:hypothetical protein